MAGVTRPLLIALAAVLATAASAAAQPQRPPSTFAPAATAIKAAVYSVELPARPEVVEEEAEDQSPTAALLRLFGEVLGRSLGAAVMLDPSGVAVTSARVVRGLTDVELVGVTGQRHTATVVGRDERTDIAVLKIRAVAAPLPAVSLADSDEVRVGDWVLAVGSPYGFEVSVSAGIISARARVSPAGGYEDSLQTDAAVNPGSVGGPLVNAQGAVIGLTVTPGPRGSGIAFAVPSNLVRRVTAEILARGRVLRGWLGLVPQSLTADLARAFGVPFTAGVLAADVLAGGPAARAGITRGTLLLALDDRALHTPLDVETHLVRTVPGQRVSVRFWREGREETLGLVLTDEPVPFARSLHAARVLGLLVDAVTPDAGVVVVGVLGGSVAAEADVRRGDFVREIDGRPVVTLADFERAAGRLAAGGDVTLLLQRGPRTFYVVLVTAEAPTRFGAAPPAATP